MAKAQSARWKREQRRETGRELEDAKRRARSQAHEIGSILESFLFWLSFIFFRVIRITSAAALEAFRKDIDANGSVLFGNTLPRGTTAGQNGRTKQDPVAVEDEDSVLS